MTTIKCEATECIWNEEKICKAESVEISEYTSCYTYEDITDGEEYQEEFWARQKDESRKLHHGKRIELCGLTFYTTDDIRTKEDRMSARMTEATTGIGCGPYGSIEERQDRVREAMKSELIKVPLMELPIYEPVSG